MFTARTMEDPLTTQLGYRELEKFAFQANFSILVSAFKDDSRL